MEGFKEEARRTAIPAKNKPEQKDIELLKKSTEKVNDTSFDLDYIPVDISTKGRFDCPAKIHIRNFTIEELLDINSASENEKSLFMLRALKSIIKEDVDPTKFLETETNEIIISLLGNNYISYLEDCDYDLTDEEVLDLKETDPTTYAKYLEAKENDISLFKVNIPISSIKKNTIADNIKEPIKLKANNYEVSFRFIRQGDILAVNDYITNKYREEENKLFLISSKLENETRTGELDTSLTIEDRKKYSDLIRNKTKDSIVAIVKLLIVEVNGEKLTTLEEKLSYIIPPVFYDKINIFLSNNSFGIVEDINVISPYSNKPTTRRFQFRPTKLLSQYRLSGDSMEFDISFG